MGLIVLVLLALAVLFALPTLVDDPGNPESMVHEAVNDGERGTGVQPPPASVAAKASPALAAEPGAVDGSSRPKGAGSERASARARAEGTLQALIKRRARLEAVAAPLWAGDDWQALVSTVEAGDQAFEQARFAAADGHWRAAMDAMQSVEGRRDEWLRRHVEAGESALELGDGAAAEAAFERALAADPDSAEARAGLERARVSDRVLAAMRAGEQAERQGDLSAALGHYQEAAGLDPDHAPAKHEVKRLAVLLRDRRFNAAMSDALAGLDSHDLDGARRALAEAARLKPDDPALADARRRLAGQGRADALGKLQAAGRIAAIREDWAAAATAYEKALALEPEAGFARTGLRRARDRLKLHEQLDHYLARPERVYGPEPLANAERLLNAAGDGGGEPGLSRKVEALRTLTEQAKQLMRVVLRSDGQTDVTVYHVARLGRFETHTLELRPGTYTVVGTRDGYRDVRRVIKLLPGQQVPPVFLACTEAI
ncbi:MAG: hypothetical protein ACPGU7_05875 [Gammaproteobacteria bacterium]